MANSTASIFIKPTVAFKCGDTFVFGSWVYTTNGTGSFQRRLTMSPNPETGLVTLPEVVTGNLAGKFGEISLYNQHADFELGSDYNSNSTSSWAIACEPATQPSRAASPLHERFTCGPCNISRAHVPGRQGDRTRVLVGLRHRPRQQLGLQSSLRLLLGFLLRVRLRVGP
jgi:hypothetical protein